MRYLRIKKGIGGMILFFLFMCYSHLIGGLQLIVNSNIWAILLQSLIIILLIYSILKLSVDEQLLCLGFAFSLFLIIFFFPQTNAISGTNGISNSLQITSGFIGFYIGYLCFDHRDIREGLKAVAIFLFIYNFWDFISGRAGSDTVYNMNFGFKAMFTSIIALYLSFTEESKWKKIFWLTIGLILFVFIIMLGSRGPFLGIFSILAFTYGSKFVMNPNISIKRKVISILSLLVLVVFFLINSESILALTAKVLGAFGLDVSSSRNWTKIISGSLFSDKNRQSLWPTFIQDFNLFGHGAYSSWDYKGVYPHNIFIEILFDFGILFGTIFIIIFLGMVFYTNRHLRNKREYALFVILLSYCIGRLITSYTFWWDTYFWMLIGVMTKFIWSYKIHKNYRAIQTIRI